MVADNGNSNTYEEARKLRLKENKKRFEDLGISKISKSLSNLTTPEKKTKQHLPKPKPAATGVLEPRRSTRTRNAVTSYSDDMDIDLPPLRKRYKSSSSSWANYVARPLDEVKLASYEDRTRALKAAEEFQNSLQSGNPSFVKSMVRSHVYSCFWLGLPTQFCKNHLPKKDLDMILEDDNGSTYDAKYLGNRTGLSGGWRGFALDHKLDDGDAVVFELVEPDKFKVCTFRVSSLLSAQTHTVNAVDKEESIAKNASKGRKKTAPHSGKTRKSNKAKANKIDDLSDTKKPQSENIDSTEKNGIVSKEDDKNIDSIEENGSDAEEDYTNMDSTEKNCSVVHNDDKNIDLIEKNGFIPEESSGDEEESVSRKKVISVDKKDKEEKRLFKPRKKRAPRYLRRNA
eukprot:XP_015583363.1 putative B3 domain-containing protein At5g58280 [Ricinus communis]